VEVAAVHVEWRQLVSRGERRRYTTMSFAAGPQRLTCLRYGRKTQVAAANMLLIADVDPLVLRRTPEDNG